MIHRFFLFVNRHRHYLTWFSVIALLSVVGFPIVMNIFDSRVKYDWEHYIEDYGNKDCESPFGAKYYNEHLKELWQGRVECDSTSLDSALNKHKGQCCNYIVFGNTDYYTHHEIVPIGDAYDSYIDTVVVDDSSSKTDLRHCKKIIDAIGTGNNIVFCNSTRDEDDAMLLTIGTNISFDINDYKHNNNNYVSKLLLYYIDAKTDTHLDSAMVWNNMLNYFYLFTAPDSTFSKEIFTYYKPYGYGKTAGIVVSPNKRFYFAARHFGKGCALMTGAPMMFSNYVLSAPDVQRVSDELLHYAFDENLPLVIINTHENIITSEDSDSRLSIFEVMFRNPATKVAMYLLITMLLLFVIFNSRRRVRSLKAVRNEQNSSLNYIRHLATLYFAKSDYKDLLETEQRKILYQLRNEYRFDVRTHSFTLPSEYSTYIALNKGVNVDDVRYVLITLETLTSSHNSVSKDDYIACINLLNTHFLNLEV